MEKINTYLDNIIENYRKEINYKFGDRENKDAICIALTILEKICEYSVNVECGHNLRNKSPVLYNLEEGDLEELVGRAFLGVVSHSRILNSHHIPYLENKVKLIIKNFPHYKSLKEDGIEIEDKLREIYKIVGLEILRKLEEMDMIKIIKTERENSYVKILDKAYEFRRKYEKCKITDLEDVYKMFVYD